MMIGDITAKLFATGAIYALNYTNWKHNRKIYCLVLYGGPDIDRVHALNLAAYEINTMERARIVNIIARLNKMPTKSILNGRMLYRIFKTYAPNEIKKCYRTYLKQYIVSAALVNSGVKNPEDIGLYEKGFQDKILAQQALKDFMVSNFNLYLKSGKMLQQVKQSFAQPIKKIFSPEEIEDMKNKAEETEAKKTTTTASTTIGSNTSIGTKPTTPTPTNDDDIEGYN